jgi:hypothetical protein
VPVFAELVVRHAYFYKWKAEDARDRAAAETSDDSHRVDDRDDDIASVDSGVSGFR